MPRWHDITYRVRPSKPKKKSTTGPVGSTTQTKVGAAYELGVALGKIEGNVAGQTNPYVGPIDLFRCRPRDKFQLIGYALVAISVAHSNHRQQHRQDSGRQRINLVTDQ